MSRQSREYMDYIIATRESGHELIAKVKSLISEGWEPLGGISHNVVGKKITYSQALTKQVKKKR